MVLQFPRHSCKRTGFHSVLSAPFWLAPATTVSAQAAALTLAPTSCLQGRMRLRLQGFLAALPVVHYQRLRKSIQGTFQRSGIVQNN